MARYPGAKWEGSPNCTPRGQKSYRGLVFHVTAGSFVGALSWLKNPVSSASAHFLNPKQGQIRQLVDTNDKAWAQRAGNNDWISVENEGQAGDSLTENQISNLVGLVLWLNKTHNIPLQLAENPKGRGLGWHGMGAPDWGHAVCPGVPIKNQRQVVLDKAKQALLPPPPVTETEQVKADEEEDEDMNRLVGCPAPDGGTWIINQDGQAYAYGGAPYFGGYTSLKPQDRQGERFFINVWPAGTKSDEGYIMLANDGHTYHFNPALWATLNK